MTVVICHNCGYNNKLLIFVFIKVANIIIWNDAGGKIMQFTKMHGAGNDYVYIDTRKTPVDDASTLAKWLSDRHKGIGSDGLVLILPSDKAHVRMRMFNSDGSEAQMCGNAIRCVGKYAFEHGIVSTDELDVETQAGIKHIKLHIKDNLVHAATVDMGAPIWTPKDIPVAYAGELALELPIKALIGNEQRDFKVSCVSMGNPHAVILGENLDTLPIAQVGPPLENHVLFPERINVEFIEIIDRKNVRMRVWERGAGETQACGTGACAVACVTARLGLTENDVNIHLLGGVLNISLAENGHVFMTGEAVTVFSGQLEMRR